jgi:DNA ligase-1
MGGRTACCRCAGLPDEEVAQRVAGYWRELDTLGRFLLTKLVGGGFRVGVSKLLVQRALASHAGSTPSAWPSA